jgi:hypothetical protein
MLTREAPDEPVGIASIRLRSCSSPHPISLPAASAVPDPAAFPTLLLLFVGVQDPHIGFQTHSGGPDAIRSIPRRHASSSVLWLLTPRSPVPSCGLR